jgi:hypothetical protein
VVIAKNALDCSLDKIGINNGSPKKAQHLVIDCVEPGLSTRCMVSA